MKLGLISPLWPPRGGGGEVYLQRSGAALAAVGVEVCACVGVAAPEPCAGVAVTPSDRDVNPDDPAACQRWFPQIAEWLRVARPTHVLINAPFSRVSHAHAHAVYAMARAQGCRIGAVHLDLDRGIVEGLAQAYAATGSWPRAAQEGERQLQALAVRFGAQVHEQIGSPLVFDVDFILSCSAWSDRFVDPLGQVPHMVFHPPMGDALAGVPRESLPPVDFGFVNPRPHKGGRCLAEILRRAPPGWRFRGLQGGHGTAFADFAQAVEEARADVQMVARVQDMRGYYDSLGALLVASLYEGYGMVGVEAMIRKTPVLARDYPAIREALGEGACFVDFTATGAEWAEAMAAMLSDRARWVAAAQARVRALADRETREVAALQGFLHEI